ncbi:MAG: hypothetical protein IPL98_15055 [Saprospiraceae bacterium]|nr:hypothetical protein [Saprospiraceae bacterium]
MPPLPTAIRVAEDPIQTPTSEPALTLGTGLHYTITLSVAVQLFASVTVTV